MEKQIKTIAIIVCVLLAGNIWFSLIMNQKINNLRNQIDSIHADSLSEFTQSSNNFDALRSDVKASIEKSESLLSSIDSQTEFKNGQIIYAVRFVPKEIRKNEKIFLTIGGDRVEAVSSNGVTFEALFSITTGQTIAPVVSFESSNAVRQEALPEEDFATRFSLGYDVDWDYGDDDSNKLEEIILLTVHARSATDDSLLSGPPSAEIIIKDAYTNAEAGRTEMQIIKAAYGKEILLQADLGEYRKQEGSYNVWVEMKTEGGIYYQDQIASFNNETNTGGKQRETRASGNGGILYPVWQ
jgi:outer membrane murein-binding lipoprotein Lpp